MGYAFPVLLTCILHNSSIENAQPLCMLGAKCSVLVQGTTPLLCGIWDEHENVKPLSVLVKQLLLGTVEPVLSEHKNGIGGP